MVDEIEKINILLVDDRIEDIEELNSILQNPLYNLVNALSGEEALRHLLHDDFAVILLDVVMPRMHGFETAQLIRESVKTQHTPIIFLTGIEKSEDYVFKGYSLGAVDYIIKPIAPIILKSKVSVFADMWAMHKRIIKYATELEVANDELKRNSEFKSNFLSTVSHELRAPLGPIKEGVTIMTDGLVGEMTIAQKDLLALIKRNTDRLNILISDILDYQKLEAGKMSLDLEENDITRDIKDVYKTLQLIVDKRGLKFETEIEEKLPKIKYDRNRIQQVLTNLVSNATKFTHSGSIKIKAAKEATFGVRVSVIDTGIGIKSEDIPKLFESFIQLAIDSGSEKGGTGLGLAISKEIILKHNGTIWVESEFGKGSAFIFVLV